MIRVIAIILFYLTFTLVPWYANKKAQQKKPVEVLDNTDNYRYIVRLPDISIEDFEITARNCTASEGQKYHRFTGKIMGSPVMGYVSDDNKKVWLGTPPVSTYVIK